MSTSTAPAARRSASYAPYWEGLAAGRLVPQYCIDSGRFQHYPRPVSVYTGSRRLEWRIASGLGHIHALTRLPEQPWNCVVELAEGVRILANLENAEGAGVGDPVRLAAEATAARGAPVFAAA